MSRVADWAERLFSVIARHDCAFAWGISDCMQMCMDAAEAMTGVHPYPKARSYRSAKGAAACLCRHGFESIIEALAAKYELVPVAQAQRGDIGIVSLGEGVLASCLCEGANFVGKAPGSEGLVRVPRAMIVQAFRVA